MRDFVTKEQPRPQKQHKSNSVSINNSSADVQDGRKMLTMSGVKKKQEKKRAKKMDEVDDEEEIYLKIY